MIKIVLADNQVMVRHGLRVLLEREPRFQVIAEATNGREACRLARELEPDIVVTDIMMDGLDGIEAARYISRNSATGVVMLSSYSARCYVLEAIRAGAKAFVLKQSSVNDLVSAIKRVNAGESYFSEAIADLVACCKEQADLEEATPFTPLTARERDVLYLAAQGYTNAEIAQQLFISRRTAETHRSQLMRKLGLHHHIDLVFYALRQGVIRDAIPVGVSRELSLRAFDVPREPEETMSFARN